MGWHDGHLPMVRAEVRLDYCTQHRGWSLTTNLVGFGHRGQVVDPSPTFCHIDLGPFDDAGDLLQQLLLEAGRLVAEAETVYLEAHPEMFPDA